MINFSQVTKKYNKVAAVDNLTFEVRQGEICGFLGPNGAGKSTTINLMLGLIYPDQGQIQIAGHLIPSELPQALKLIGASLERPSFYPFLSGRDNLHVLAKMRGEKTLDVEKTLESVGLSKRANDKFGTYSMGMKQRLGLAAALFSNPQLLILDEPTNGLDPVGMIEIRNLLKHLHSEGKTIFLSSHLLDEVEQICSYIIMIDKGKLLTQGSLYELLGPGNELIRLSIRQPSLPAKELLKEQGFWVPPWSYNSKYLWFGLQNGDCEENVLSCLEQLDVSIIEKKIFPKKLETLFMALAAPNKN